MSSRNYCCSPLRLFDDGGFLSINVRPKVRHFQRTGKQTSRPGLVVAKSRSGLLRGNHSGLYVILTVLVAPAGMVVE